MAEETGQAAQAPAVAAGKVDLCGSYRHKVDEKGRVSMPASFRKILSEDLVVTVNPKDECLYVFEPAGFNEWVDEAFVNRFGRYDSTDPMHVALRRKLKARVSPTTRDKVGRISLDATLRKAAGIERDVVIVGNTGYFEIWDAKRFDECDEMYSLNLLFG